MFNTERCLITLCKIFIRRKQRSLAAIARLKAARGEILARLEHGGGARLADRAASPPAAAPRPEPPAEKSA